PHAMYQGADPMPSKLLCEARIATMKMSSALAILLAPGNFASGVCATTRPPAVAKMIVHDVTDRKADSGITPPSARDSTHAPSATPSHSSTVSGVIGPACSGTCATMSATGLALVQRSNAGARRASENNTATHSE